MCIIFATLTWPENPADAISEVLNSKIFLEEHVSVALPVPEQLLYSGYATGIYFSFSLHWLLWSWRILRPGNKAGGSVHKVTVKFCCYGNMYHTHVELDIEFTSAPFHNQEWDWGNDIHVARQRGSQTTSLLQVRLFLLSFLLFLLPLPLWKEEHYYGNTQH